MKKFSLAIAALLLLTGCGSDASTSEPSDTGEDVPYLYPDTVTLNDGQVVECVINYHVNAVWCTPSEGSDY